MSNYSDQAQAVAAGHLGEPDLLARVLAGIAGESAELGRQIETLGARLTGGDEPPDRLTLAIEMQAFDRLAQNAHALAVIQAQLARFQLLGIGYDVDGIRVAISRMPLPEVRQRLLRAIGIEAAPCVAVEAEDILWMDAS
jgi:hypothetical protein